VEFALELISSSPRVQAPTKADDHEFQFRVTDSTDITGAQPWRRNLVDRVRPPLNLRQYRGASEAATQVSRTPDARMTALATATGLVCGVGAWRVKHARPVVALLAVIAFAYTAHVALRARRQYKRDQQIDEASAESFPASDAPAISPKE
jgi:hypothetical protein